MLIYLDACCINRIFDEQTQLRIQFETMAIRAILQRVDDGEWDWLGSEAINDEIGQTSVEHRLGEIRILLLGVTMMAVWGKSSVQNRALALRKLGFGDFDALHLAVAEANKASVFLTTDDKLLRRAVRNKSELRVDVQNPITWLMEVEKREQTQIDS